MKNKWLLVIFAIVVLALLLCSCTTQKRCIRKFPPQTVIERTDSIVMRDTIIYHDRVIRDTIEADTVFIEKVISIPGEINISPVEAENRYSRAKAWIENQRLKLQLETKEQVIQKILKDAEKETIRWKEMYYSEITKESQIVYKPKKIHKISMWLSGIFILLSALFIYLKIKR